MRISQRYNLEDKFNDTLHVFCKAEAGHAELLNNKEAFSVSQHGRDSRFKARDRSTR